MKKLLLTLGTGAASIAPIAMVVACGETEVETPVEENKTETPKEETTEDVIDSAIQNDLDIISDNVASITARTGWDAMNYNHYLEKDIVAADFLIVGGIKADTFDSALIENWTIDRLSWDEDKGFHWLIVKNLGIEYKIKTKVLNWEESIEEIESFVKTTSFTPQYPIGSDFSLSVGELFNWIGISEDVFEPIIWDRFEYKFIGKYTGDILSVEIKHLDNPNVKETRIIYPLPIEETPSETPGQVDTPSQSLEDYLQIDGQDFIPEKDKFIIMKDYYYNGSLWSGNNKDGSLDPASYVDLVEGSTWAADQGVVQIDDGDSIVVVYDADDEDGININNFDETVAFVDTSMSSNQDIQDINTAMGNGVSSGWFGDSSLPLFKDGKLLPYIGGQSNHNNPDLSFQDTLKIVKDQLTIEGFEAVLSYYAYMNSTDENGDYLRDPNILNGANTGFMPFVAEAGLLSYEKIAKNAIKITYNNDNSEFGLPASQMAFIELITGEANSFTLSEFGKFTFGSNSWQAYENHSTDYTFKARKDIYINA